MDKFYNVYGATLAVAQDCSIVEFDNIRQAADSNPICVLKAKLTFERMLIRGLNENWYQNTRYKIYSSKDSIADSVEIGSWCIKNLYLPRNSDTLCYDFIDPLGKIARQEFKGIQNYKALSQAFRKIRKVSNYESVLNCNLILENQRLKEELRKLKENS